MSLDELVNSFVNLDEKKTLSLVQEALKEYGPAEIIEACRKATDIVGNKFENGEYFLSELVFAGYIFNKVMDILLPELQKTETKHLGKVVLGTVEGDIHDIGKNIFKAFAEAAGFKIIDIGIDVPPEKFVEATKTHNPDIVGLSGLLTLAIDAMKRTVDALKSAGLKDKVKVIIGGGRVDENANQYVGSDAWADSATKGVKLCKQLIGAKEENPKTT